MGIKTFAAVAVLSAVLANGPARAANWQPISNGTQTIDINRSQIGQGGNGLVMVWSRASLPQTLADAEGKYNGIEALNRYDCTSHRFVTLKRIYLRDNTLIHVESVLAPKEMDIAAGSIDAAIAADVCKAAPPPGRVIDAATPDAAGVHYADVQKLDSTEPPPFVSVAEATASIGGTKPAAGKSGAADAPPPHRFITLPHIDPSQVQHPTDEPPPAEVTKGSAAAAKREAAKSGVSIEPVLRGLDRHSREVVLATSGPQRKATSRRAAAKQTAADEAEHKDLHWSYEGEGAPSNWGNLRPDFRLCDSGQRQSPIDIHDGIRVDLEPIKFDYHSAMFHIIDNGHTVQVDFGEGNTITVQGRTYRLVQLHFHRPSEERVEGQSFEMVMHLVHKDDDGRLAVIAVLLERGTEHPVIQTFWNNLPLETNVALSPATAVDLNKLLPDTRTYYTYMGSLTTPPCTEGVLWMVMKRPVQLSDDQIAIFTRLYRNNARPVQPANGRLIKESR